MNKKQAYEIQGRKAEQRVVQYLRLRGYKIWEQRFKTTEGEIDIIAQKGKIFAFIEVKQRATQSAIDEAMDARTEKRIITCAEIWIERHYNMLPDDFEIRFDFASIIGPVNPLTKVIYLKEAFYTY